MNPSIAGEGLGFCVCGSHIEAGEMVVMVQGKAAHVNCRQQAMRAGPGQMDLWRSDFLFDQEQLDALERAEEVTSAAHISFDGPDLLALDVPRLAGQTAKVFELMRDGEFRTLTQIARACGCLETSAGARLRDLRKERFGGHRVVSRQVSGTSLLYEYQLILNNGPATQTTDERQQAA